MSSIVTVAVAVLLFPLVSVTVNITVLIPTSEQLKVVLSRLIEAIPQLSVEPLSISVVEIVTFPEASNGTVKFLVITVGCTVSTVLIYAFFIIVLLHPSLSVTVKLTSNSPFSV